MWHPLPGYPVFVTAVPVPRVTVALRVRLIKLVGLAVDAAALGGLLAHELVVHHSLLPLHLLVCLGFPQLQHQRLTLGISMDQTTVTA